MFRDFFFANMDVVYLVYGLAFILLGAVVFLQLGITEKSEYKLLKILWLLGFFGITYGIHELLDMLINIRGETTYLIFVSTEFLVLAYFLLFQFGYKLINDVTKNKVTTWFPILILILFFTLTIYLFFNKYLDQKTFVIVSKYLLGFPAMLFTSIGFYLYYLSESEKIDQLNLKKHFRFASIMFMSYSFLGGLIVTENNFFPASLINNQNFFAFFGVPIQIFRTFNAIGISWSIWNIMNIFNIEEAAAHKSAENKVKNQAVLLDKAQDSIIVWNMEHCITYLNKSASQLYGFTEEEMITKNANELLFKEDSSVFFKATNEVIENGEWAGQLYQITKEGKELIVESRWTLIRDSEGAPKEILVINNNITEKVKLLSDINEREKTNNVLKIFALALEEAPDGVQIVDLNGHIIYSNKTVEKIYGFSNEEFKGKHVDELNECTQSEHIMIIPVLKNTGHWNGELEVKHKNGKTIPVFINASIFSDELGKPVAIIKIIRDLTEQKDIEQLEKQLLQADKLATIGQLASGVAHEINTPLGNISLYTQMLLKKIEDEGDRDKLNIIYDESNRAANIVKSLLDFARQSTPDMTPSDINSTIIKSLNLLKHQMKDVKVTTMFQTLPEINCDLHQIQQVIMNLLSNAIQSFKNDGEIKIETGLKNNNVEIIITDNGCGIPEKNLTNIFEPFFTTKNVGDGTGLGLSISYGVIKSHNGSIDVKSQVGKGTTFIIKLPVH
ncbi:MAG: PAS domain S-box protein [Methanosarcinaceae archaeon]|nr:PAS domain S-box protein [Methanosarcinaceae archaeon]